MSTSPRQTQRKTTQPKTEPKTEPKDSTPLQQSIEEPIATAPPEVQMILRAVIRTEKDNLHLKKTRVKGDILKIIKTAIQ